MSDMKAITRMHRLVWLCAEAKSIRHTMCYRTVTAGANDGFCCKHLKTLTHWTMPESFRV